MSGMSGVNRLPLENYKCLECGTQYLTEEIQDTWKCPDCGSLIHIYAEDPETETRIVLLRKAAKEIEPGDLVHLPGALRKDCYMVLGINTKGNKLGLGLKGYGQFLVSRDEPINCRTGAW